MIEPTLEYLKETIIRLNSWRDWLICLIIGGHMNIGSGWWRILMIIAFVSSKDAGIEITLDRETTLNAFIAWRLLGDGTVCVHIYLRDHVMADF